MTSKRFASASIPFILELSFFLDPEPNAGTGTGYRL